MRRLTPGILGSTPDEVNGKFTPNGKFHAVGMDFDSQQAFVEAGYPCRYQEPTDALFDHSGQGRTAMERGYL